MLLQLSLQGLLSRAVGGLGLISDPASLGLGCLSCRVGALASFAGHICKASSDVELSALLQYLTNQLRDVKGNDLPVLRELISVMTVRLGFRDPFL